METLLLKGKPVLDSIKETLVPRVENLKASDIVPQLAAILVGDDPASHVYVRNKSKAFERLNCKSKTYKIPADTTEKDLLELDALKQLNKKLQEENAKLKAQNEKLKLLSSKNLEENKASKELIVELLKENEKIKFEKEIFKNKILKEMNRQHTRKEYLKLVSEIKTILPDCGLSQDMITGFPNETEKLYPFSPLNNA